MGRKSECCMRTYISGEREETRFPMDRESGRQRSLFDPRPNVSSSFRPTLPPLDPPRGMPSPPYTYRTHSPQPPQMAYPAPATTTAQVAWPTEPPRGMPSQPAPAPSYQYDPRYQQNNGTYYTNQFPDQRSRLPPLTMPHVDYRANPSPLYPAAAAATPAHHHHPHHHAAHTHPGTASHHQQPNSRPYYPSPSPQPSRSSYPQPVPFASAEWSTSVPDIAHHSRADSYVTATNYATGGTHHGGAYAPSDRDMWSPGGHADLASASSDRGESQEPLVKKKRKRADANQLRVLNATYQRTAFPSTQEREALAKELDMSPRSVQIWFQNKRQSMRQSRNAANNLPPILNHSYPNPAPADQGLRSPQYLSIEGTSSRSRREPTPDRRR